MIRFSVDNFLPFLGSATSVVSSKPVFPILSCVMIHAKTEGYVMLTASDGETWFTTKAPCITVTENVETCVDAMDLSRALANLKGADVEITIDDDKHQMLCDYSQGHFALPIMSCQEFPSLESPKDSKSVILDAHALTTAINKTLFATANDDLRPVMNGINFAFDASGMACGATDGHRLVKYVYKDLCIIGDDYNVTLPTKPASIVKAVLDGIESKVRMAWDDRMLSVSNEAFRLVTRLCEQKYPDYNRVIPTDNDIEAVVEKDAIVMALKRVTPMCQASSELVKFVFDKDGLMLEAEDYDMSKAAKEKVSCNYMNEHIAIGFKAPLALLLLSNIDTEKVNIAFKDEKHAVLFRPVVDSDSAQESEYTSLLMPMIITM